jgi:hypothetical protein
MTARLPPFPLRASTQADHALARRASLDHYWSRHGARLAAAGVTLEKLRAALVTVGGGRGPRGGWAQRESRCNWASFAHRRAAKGWCTLTGYGGDWLLAAVRLTTLLAPRAPALTLAPARSPPAGLRAPATARTPARARSCPAWTPSTSEHAAAAAAGGRWHRHPGCVDLQAPARGPSFDFFEPSCGRA